MIRFGVRRSLLSYIAAVVLVLLPALQGWSGWSQTVSTAQLSGTVHDPSSALIPGASVTVADASKGFSSSACALPTTSEKSAMAAVALK